MNRSEDTRCPNCGDYTRISFEEGTEPPCNEWEFECYNCGFPITMILEKEVTNG